MFSESLIHLTTSLINKTLSEFSLHFLLRGNSQHKDAVTLVYANKNQQVRKKALRVLTPEFNSFFVQEYKRPGLTELQFCLLTLF